MKTSSPESGYSQQELAADEQIRQKIVRQGVSALTDAELLSIVIRDGGKDRSALKLGTELLAHYNNSLTELGLADVSRLRMFGGMGLGRAVVVAAAMELGKRRKAEEAVSIQTITTKEDVVSLFKPLIAELPHEEFWALYLGASHRILDKIKISQGGVAGTVVDNRLIIKRALDKLAAAILIVHNHPSGISTPSPEDRTLTDRLKQAAALFDIQLTDHIIITSGECFSFRAEGLI